MSSSYRLGLIGVLLASVAQSQSPAVAPPAQPNSTAASASVKVPAKTSPPTRYLPDKFAGSAGRYYKLVWGVDSLDVKTAESGELIRFSWRVLDPERAQMLNDKKATPSLIDPQAGVSLVIPVMDKIGQLRQSATPEAGKAYWMAFSNKGRLVKHGDRVTVVIGEFRAEGLVVN